MNTIHLRSLDIRARVQHTLRVVERAEKTTAGGDPFIILTLGNASGDIDTAPIWKNLLDEGWADGAVRGAAVQAIGQVDRYEARGNAKRQLNLTAPVRVLPREGLDLSQFLPHIAEDPQKLWEKWTNARGMSSQQLKRVLGLFYDENAFRLRFERAPASVGGHHSKAVCCTCGRSPTSRAGWRRRCARARTSCSPRAVARHREDRSVRHRLRGLHANERRPSHRARDPGIDDAR